MRNFYNRFSNLIPLLFFLYIDDYLYEYYIRHIDNCQYVFKNIFKLIEKIIYLSFKNIKNITSKYNKLY